jgi:predicted nucleic acid-binding protein
MLSNPIWLVVYLGLYTLEACVGKKTGILMKRLRIYADTSVFGGYFDAEFADASKRFFRDIREGRIVLLISGVVRVELEKSPPKVHDLLRSLNEANVVEVEVGEDVIGLRDAYLAAGVVSERWIEDATHVAAATVGNADAIVSWNFRHIVNLRRILAFNGVNVSQGYKPLQIISPLELTHENED